MVDVERQSKSVSTRPSDERTEFVDEQHCEGVGRSNRRPNLDLAIQLVGWCCVSGHRYRVPLAWSKCGYLRRFSTVRWGPPLPLAYSSFAIRFSEALWLGSGVPPRSAEGHRPEVGEGDPGPSRWLRPVVRSGRRQPPG